MSILVTGGAGYIGSHCVQKLVDEGHQVVILDNLSTGYRSLIRTSLFIEGSIEDIELVTDTLRRYQVQTVMHLAASCYVGESVTHPAMYYQNNVSAMVNLLVAMQQADVNQLIFSSSCAVYGIPASNSTITKETPLNPTTPYGFSKLVGEQMLSHFAHAYGLRYLTLRYFNAAGADAQGRMGKIHTTGPHLIPSAMKALRQEAPPLEILGTDYPTPDGTCIRDFIHVEDIAHAHALALDYLAGEGPSAVVNLGTGTGYSVKQVLAALERVAEQPVPTKLGPRRPGDPPCLVANADKARQLLGWQPRYTDLDAILQTAWQWEQHGAPQPSQ
jgi:UDP-glucose-4-epimerase GalE